MPFLSDHCDQCHYGQKKSNVYAISAWFYVSVLKDILVLLMRPDTIALRKDLGELMDSLLLSEIFRKFNTNLPSSASVERLFSAAGRVLTPLRASLSDEAFEAQLLLKCNKDL